MIDIYLKIQHASYYHKKTEIIYENQKITTGAMILIIIEKKRM